MMEELPAVSSDRPRLPSVERNIKIWEKIVTRRYQKGFEDQSIAPYLSSSYRWYGVHGAQYRWGNRGERSLYKKHFARLQAAFPDITLTHHMFGEGGLVGNYFIIHATHKGSYFDVLPTHRSVCIFGTAIARFDAQGLLVEERELWDEVTLLRQLGVLVNSSDNLLAMVNQSSFHPGSKYQPKPPPPIDDLLYRNENDKQDNRNPQVERNIKHWQKFLNIKYFDQNFDRLDEVMSACWCWHGPAGWKWDVSDPQQRLSGFEELKARGQLVTDYVFHYRTFGEGNYMLYNIVCEYTHSIEMFGVSATGRSLRHSNIAVCRFDPQGKIVEEWEMLDVLSIYKQLGVIPDDNAITSLVSFLNV